VKKTYVVNDLVWIGFAVLVSVLGFKLGFGSFHQPLAGFMPVLAAFLLGGLAIVDLISGTMKSWKDEKIDGEIWAGINWGKLILTLVILFIYTALFSFVGFIISTVLLLIILFRLMEPRPWWVVIAASLATTFLFYIGFKIGLESQLPAGFLGF
jgi:hypothetical protein